MSTRSAIVFPTIKTTLNNVKKKVETNHRIWLKLILSGLIPIMIKLFTIVTAVVQQQLSFQKREQEKHESFLLRQQANIHVDNLLKESILVTYLNDVSKLLMLNNNTNTLIHIRTKTLTN